jgi:PsbP-like protein
MKIALRLRGTTIKLSIIIILTTFSVVTTSFFMLSSPASVKAAAFPPSAIDANQMPSQNSGSLAVFATLCGLFGGHDYGACPVSPDKMEAPPPPPSSDNASSNYLTYENATFGFKMRYPSDWIKEETTTRDLRVENAHGTPYAYLPREPDSLSLQLHPPNTRYFAGLYGMLISIHKVPSSPLLEQLIAKIIDNHSHGNAFDIYRIMELTPTTLSGQHAYKLLYENEDYILPPLAKQKQMEIVAIKRDINGIKEYDISYNTPTQLYPTYLPTIQKMIDSFEFLPVTQQH